MPSVVSKFAEPRRLLNIRSEYYAGAVFFSSLAYYWGPSLYSYITTPNIKSGKDPTNNNKGKVPDVENCEILEEEQSNKILKLAQKIPAFNLEFILQFIKLIRIMIPSFFCKEIFLLAGHTISLIFRTFLSIYVANMEGQIVKYIVRKDPDNFVRMLTKWFTIALPATFINSMIRYLESKLAVAFRTRLVDHSYQLYFKNQVYYRTTVLDSRLENCAQLLTDDLETVATVIARLYSQITKPLFDLLLIGVALAKLTISAKASLIHGPVLCVSVVGFTACVLRLVSPQFGRLVAQEAAKRGKLRFIHGRVITHAEEIAFYDGAKIELGQVKDAYKDLIGHLNKIFGVKLWFIFLEQFLMKYCWSGAGMIVVSLPILYSRAGNNNENGISERTQYFTTAKNLLHGASDAVERLMSSYKDIVELSGQTSRVTHMLKVFEEISAGTYVKNIVRSAHAPILIKGRVTTSSDSIEITNLPIITPNGEIVCKSLTLNLLPGQHLLITGPNGCGKSSLFRILSGLWPVYSGQLKTPARCKLFYIPQRPYLTLGNLRDQVIYPQNKTDTSDDQLSDILCLVKLEHLIKRDGWDSVKDWNEILSGGEKQRLSIARLFFHKPKYALLDECTSAVSIDVEAFLYKTAIELNITLLTITHRPTLWKFHTHILQFDGSGGWVFSLLDAEKRLKLKEEKAKLLEMAKTEQRDVRLAELSKLLGEDINV